MGSGSGLLSDGREGVIIPNYLLLHVTCTNIRQALLSILDNSPVKIASRRRDITSQNVGYPSVLR